MPTTASSLLALAVSDARTALAKCAAYRTALGAASEAAALAVTHLVDAAAAIDTSHCILTAMPAGQEPMGGEAALHDFQIVGVLHVVQPSGADADDFVAGYNVEDLVRELRTIYDGTTQAFELVGVEVSPPVRGEPGSVDADSLMIEVMLTLEALR